MDPELIEGALVWGASQGSTGGAGIWNNLLSLLPPQPNTRQEEGDGLVHAVKTTTPTKETGNVRRFVQHLSEHLLLAPAIFRFNLQRYFLLIFKHTQT